MTIRDVSARLGLHVPAVYHAVKTYPSMIDDMAQYGEIGPKTGGDGVTRTRISLPGELNGESGAYEWIIEPNGVDVNHRFFNTKPIEFDQ